MLALKSSWLLGWSLLSTLLRRALGRGIRGERAVLALYRGDLPPDLPEGARAEWLGLGTCIACGACDAIAARRIEAPASLMSMVIASLRSTGELRAVAPELARLDDSFLALTERQCPTGFGFRRLGSLACRLVGSRGATGPGESPR